MKKIVQIKNLDKWFPRSQNIKDKIQGKPKEYVKAVNNITIDIFEGENLGLVGESGCGKSTLAKTLLRLYKPTNGQIIVDKTDITNLSGKPLRQIRPNMQMIFQDPYSSLNPSMSVYEIIAEVLTVHGKTKGKLETEKKVGELLEMCGLSRDVASRQPGEFSGGQRQRIGIARALTLEPKFIIADEPVSALDVSIQAQIINLLKTLQSKLGLTILFISHDLNVVHYITNRVLVMYLGHSVELGPTSDLFDKPLHPYTEILSKASPILDPTIRDNTQLIDGDLPSPINMPNGCKFHSRCPYCQDKCKTELPIWREVTDQRFCACHFPLNI